MTTYTIFIILSSVIIIFTTIHAIYQKKVNHLTPFLFFLVFYQLSLSKQTTNMLSIVTLLASLLVYFDKKD